MPKDSKKSMFEQWSLLLKAVNLYEADLAGVAPFREALEEAYAAAQASQIVQNARRASSKKATRQLRAHLDASGDAAICLRSFIKGVLGPRSKLLFQFGIKPRPSRRRPNPGRKQPMGFEQAL